MSRLRRPILHSRFFFVTTNLRRGLRPFSDTEYQLLAESLIRVRELVPVAICAYCFMPDHVHLLAEGINDVSDLRRFVTLFKQRSGYRYGRTTRRRLWEVGYYDHVLRDEENTAKVVSYILHNPVKAGLVQRPQDYPYAGSDVFTLQDLLEINPQG